MKTIAILLAFLTALSFAAFAADKPANASKLRHVVAFKFKSSASPAQIQEVVEAFRGLKKKISVVKEFEWGTNISPEKRDKGFTHGFIITFTSEKDRDAYLVHPEHEAFVKKILPVIDDVFVIDYWAQE
jgi:hypothetical protein